MYVALYLPMYKQLDNHSKDMYRYHEEVYNDEFIQYTHEKMTSEKSKSQIHHKYGYIA